MMEFLREGEGEGDKGAPFSRKEKEIREHHSPGK